MAVYVDKVLRGAKAGDLPVETLARYKLIVNLKTAREIGLTFPPRCSGKLTVRSSKTGLKSSTVLLAPHTRSGLSAEQIAPHSSPCTTLTIAM